MEKEKEEGKSYCTICDLETSPIIRCVCPERQSDGGWKDTNKEGEKYTIKEIERACRLYLQGAWNDQSEIRAESPEGKEIIWGGLFGKEITKHWEKIKGFLTPKQ